MTDPRHIQSLIIYRDNLESGVLRRTENGCSFEFNNGFLNNSRFDGQSYLMKKTTRPLIITGANLPPFFAGLLPEGLRLRALISNLKTSPDDLFSLFASAGNRVIGDVFAGSTSEKLSAIDFPKLKEIDFYEYLDQILRSNSYQMGEDAIAGVQEKISASMINFPLNIAKSKFSFILKLNPKDKPNLIENEFHCMHLAKVCGIDTAKVKLVRDKNDNTGLLVQRFDRTWDERENRFLMHHQEDACQFLDRYPADKYIISMNEIARGIEKVTTATPAILLKLLRVFCFSYLVGNGDLHAKNISLMTLCNSRFVDLTPAYDLICTFIYGDQRMASKFDGNDETIRRSMVIDFGRRFGILPKATEHILDRLLSDFRKHHELVFRIPISEKTRKNLQRIIEKRLKDLEGR
ncbi:MAG: type II toxin-antitoxin system HipA family toxin [Candidatus Ozemobacteraceae bacterium]